jgi:ParB/RepB/Spo0J family partition protein
MTELQTPAQAAAGGYGFQILERTAVVPSPTNPRKRFDPTALEELAENIKGIGLAEPILVRPLPGARLQETWTDRRAGEPAPTHEIVAGERRWRACGLAGVKKIPAMVRDLTDSQVLRLQVIENLQREDLHPLEEADGYRKILDVPEDADKPMKDRVEALAREIGKSTRYIYQTLQLLKLAEFPRQVFLEGKLQRTTAAPIATIGNEAQQIEACRRIAGLGRSGTDVIEQPLSAREAEEYVRSNFRLLLAKAPFPIKVEFAGVGPCQACDKMSANARDLFAEGDKVPDTCMDPSCYGKKNAKHTEQLAAAAKAKGQRVITGKEAKKLLPHEYSPTSFDYRSDYQSLDEKRWDAAGKNEGKTVKQLLGNDMPTPALIARPDGQGFVEALPKKDVERMLKERGLLKQRPTSANNAQADAERKARLIKEQRWAVATAILQALAAIPANAPQPLNLADQNGLRAHLMLPMVEQMHRALDHDGRKRLNKLLDLDEKTMPLHPHGDVVEKYLKGVDGAGVNRFIVACLVAGELHYAQYCHPSTDNLDMLCALLKVDGKKIAAAIAAEKKAAKAKKAPAAKKAAPARAAKADTKAAPAAAASSDTPTRAFMAGDRVRFKEGLKGPNGMLRKVCGREGDISRICPGGAYLVRTGSKGEGQGVRASASELELVKASENPAASAWPFPKANATTPTKLVKPAKRSKANADEAALQGELTLSTGVKLSPQPAWPFPTAGKPAEVQP